MDKKVLQAYAIWAKENLERQVEVSLKTIGINSDSDIKNSKIVGDYTVIEGDQNSYPKSLHGKREYIISLIKSNSYQSVIEEFAYTWFNRFVALRFMEVHDFLPHGFRVLSSRDGSIEPEIIKNLTFLKAELKLDIELCEKLKLVGIEELYRYVLFRQCKALAGILPMLFEEDNDCMELLLPKTLLLGDTVLTKLVALGEEIFLEDVEVIGWLYQFYISSKKDEVYKSKKTITKDTLPAVTQLFTPDWIVRYMAENSVGRLWLESYPESSLHDEMKYFVENPIQSDEVQCKIDAIKYKDVQPQDIKIMEPCCGSGHILVYVFDLLYKMYEEKGYQKRDIPTLILKYNLYGLDVDKRASQLAAFSLVMKARSINNRFFNENYYIKPQVYEIWDSRGLYNIGYKHLMEETKMFSYDAIEDIEYIAESFKYAKTIGSLLKIKEMNWERIDETIDILENKVVYNIFNKKLDSVGLKLIKKLVMQAKILSFKYDVMITNPPYIGISSMEEPVREYANTFYPNSKADMFAMFMETGFVKANGFLAMINMHSWMFLSSFEKLRRNLINTQEIITMAHLGTHAFETIGGEVVQTTAFVMRNAKLGGNGAYFRLVDSKDKLKDFLDNISQGQIRFVIDSNNFFKIPGSPFAYWVKNAIFDAFQTGTNITKYVDTFQGIITGDNEKFLRVWFEVCNKKIAFSKKSFKDFSLNEQYWIPYNKGGEFRKWYGNQDYVVYWKNGPSDKTRGKKSYEKFYLRDYVSWSYIASTTLATRYYPQGFLWDVAGSGIFAKENYLLYLQGLIGSKVGIMILNIINPTLNYQVENIAQLPILLNKVDKVEQVVRKNVDEACCEWDKYEISWNFKKHPLI